MMNFKYLCAGALALVLATGQICAQNDSVVKTRKDAELLIPRIPRQPVQPLDPSKQVMDTITTQTPGVKILLMTVKKVFIHEGAEKPDRAGCA